MGVKFPGHQAYRHSCPMPHAPSHRTSRATPGTNHSALGTRPSALKNQKTTYPEHLEADVVLRNGRTLRLRPVRPEDNDRLLSFFGRLSPQSLHSRFFDAVSPARAAEYSPARVDYDREFGVVGEVSSDIIAVAHYFASRGT